MSSSPIDGHDWTKSTLELIGIPAVYVEVSGTIRASNQAFKAWTGWADESGPAVNLNHVMPEFKQTLLQVKPGQELCLEWKNDASLLPPAVLHFTGFFSNNGRLDHVILKCEPLTTATSQKTTDSDEQFEQAMEQLGDAVAVVNSSTQDLVFVNSAFCRLYRISRELAIGRAVKLFIHPKSHHNFHDVMSRLRLQKTVLTETTDVRNDGSPFASEVHLTTMHLRGQLCFLAVIRDITIRKETQEAIQREKTFVDTVIKYAGEGLCVCHEIDQSPFVKFTVWNDQMVSISGYTIDEVNLSGWYQLVYPDEEIRNKAISRMDRMREGDDLVAEEWVITRKDGVERILEITTSVLGGDTIHVLALMNDVTERRDLEEHLIHAQKMEAIGTLAGGIAHDFNNLLSPILGYAEIISQESQNNQKLKKAATDIQKAALRAKNLTRQILAFSSKQTLQLEDIDLNTTIKQFNHILAGSLRDDIQLKLLLHKRPCYIRGDSGQIEQILMNLVLNAQDAMPSGGTCKIRTQTIYVDPSMEDRSSIMESGSYVLLSIQDHGIGMDKKTQINMFEPFFTTKPSGKGTGLGLSSVYGIVQQHFGHVDVLSESGKGTSISIYFPRLESYTDSLELESSTSKFEESGGTILLVEDNTMVREMAQEILERSGYRILVATGPKQAIKIFEDNQSEIDLLLSDVDMPEMNGKELFYTLRKSQPDLRVLFMSGYADNIIIDKDSEKQDPFIQKPFRMADLTQKVRLVLTN